jgi:hypothetical protein
VFWGGRVWRENLLTDGFELLEEMRMVDSIELVEVDVYLLGGVERGELTEGVDAI